jgi:hypothetical protein
MKVTRSYLVRLVQEFDIDEEDVAGIDPDSPEFDDAVCEHVPISEDHEPIDNDGLEWTINGLPSWQYAEDERILAPLLAGIAKNIPPF